MNARVHLFYLVAGDLDRGIVFRRERHGFIESQVTRLRVRQDPHAIASSTAAATGAIPLRSWVETSEPRLRIALVNQNVNHGNHDKSEEHRTYQSECNCTP